MWRWLLLSLDATSSESLALGYLSCGYTLVQYFLYLNRGVQIDSSSLCCCARLQWGGSHGLLLGSVFYAFWIGLPCLYLVPLWAYNPRPMEVNQLNHSPMIRLLKLNKKKKVRKKKKTLNHMEQLQCTQNYFFFFSFFLLIIR